MKKLLLVLAVFAVSCGEVASEPVTATQEALSPGSYCLSSPTAPPGQACGGYGVLMGSYACNGQTYRAYFSYSQGINGSGNWYIQSFRGAGFAGSTNMNLDCGSSGPNYTMLMTHGSGFLYLSQTTSCRFFHVDNNGSVIWSTPVTLPGGNLQYYPATTANPNGSWATWIVTPNDPANGLCGNIQFSWTTN
jgi:hypothetical protein